MVEIQGGARIIKKISEAVLLGKKILYENLTKIQHFFDDIVEEESSSDLKIRGEDSRKLQYSIALAAISITFGFWLFEYSKYQSYFLLDQLSVVIIIIISTISVISGISLLLHILLEGASMSNFEHFSLILSKRYFKYLSNLFFDLSFIFIVPILFCFVAYVIISIYLFYPAQLIELQVNTTILYVVVISGFILISIDLWYSNRVESKNTEKKSKQIIKSVSFLIVLMLYMSLFYFISVYFIDNLIEVGFHTDKTVYDVNSDERVIITSKFVSPLPANVKGDYMGEVRGPGNKSHSFRLTKLSDNELIGVLPLENKEVGKYTIKLPPLKLVKEHPIETNFLVCNMSKPFPCSPFDNTSQ